MQRNAKFNRIAKTGTATFFLKVVLQLFDMHKARNNISNSGERVKNCNLVVANKMRKAKMFEHDTHSAIAE